MRGYADQYRGVRNPYDGVWYLQTRHRERNGVVFDVYRHSDAVLAACLPPGAARALMGKYPGRFQIHQDARDATVLLFSEVELHELAHDIKLRRRRRLSRGDQGKLVAAGREFQFATG